MANRNYANGGKIYAMHVSPVIQNTTITIGATGAVTAFAGTQTKGVTRVSTGIYRIDSTDNYNLVLSVQSSVRSPVSGLSGISSIEIQNAPTTSMQSLTAPSITIKTKDATGALADPASGSVLDVLVLLNNSSVKA